MILGLLTYLLVISAPLTLVVMAILPVLAWLISYSSRKMRSKHVDMQEVNTAIMGKLSEAKSGLRDIKLYGLEKNVSRYFSELLARFSRLNIDATRIQARNLPIVQLIATTGVATIIYFAFGLRERDALTAGAVVSYIAALAMLFEPLRRLASLNMLLQKAFVALDSLEVFLRTPVEIFGSSGQLSASLQSFEIKDASFRYKDSNEWIFCNLNLCLNAGDVVAIRGPSGSGKSTLSDLILGFQNLDKGEILVNGVSVPSTDLRRYFSVVSQSPVIFDGTVRENLLCGNSVDSDQRMLSALQLAGLFELGGVRGERLLDYQVGEWGARLSGGQRQRLALARSLLRDAPILLIDEGTSALDSETEALVFKNVVTKSTHRIIIFITHSDDILSQCGRIIDIGEKQ
jgi:ATP-binding cassette, subfamily B, bacterial MsbA